MIDWFLLCRSCDGFVHWIGLETLILVLILAWLLGRLATEVDATVTELEGTFVCHRLIELGKFVRIVLSQHTLTPSLCENILHLGRMLHRLGLNL